ncbi:hypothetical protein LTR16_001067 [Cryomyces antarcticus]|uniref:tRNA (guanine(10)-N(2))-methyltransferase n=1 Tax=Cryomyces antarcticus TaxID=329879 RepID=A0ABR0LQH7_9PEZI|nr:hypothetical protein LTR16_001067 [Cryomyces antarcticus]
MDYLVRLAQIHESFRKPELEALAALANINIEFLAYADESPFCIIRLQSEAAARTLIARSILSQGIYELWGSGVDYPSLHADVTARTKVQWRRYRDCSFRFALDGFQGKRSPSSQRDVMESFQYMGFDGPIQMNDAELSMCIFEEYERKARTPKILHLGRLIASSGRRAKATYDLKKRKYISTTSMDSELALVTANLAHAAPGRLFYDPFMGTGSFPIACAHFGAVTLGSDIDGRSIRGKKDRDVVSNFVQYGIAGRYLDGFVSDLTHTSLRTARYLDGIVCDPPYGVREGLKVLGSAKAESGKAVVLNNGELAHLQEGFVPPKRPYSFEAMLDDILDFAASMLVENGRLAMWMPTANDDDVELAIPSHPSLELISVCVQAFNKWSRRLLTYRRLPDAQVDSTAPRPQRTYVAGATADELNSFRRKYFEGFKNASGTSTP